MSRRGEKGKGGRGTSRKKEGEEERRQGYSGGWRGERRQGYSGGRRGEREGRGIMVVGEEREKAGV